MRGLVTFADFREIPSLRCTSGAPPPPPDTYRHLSLFRPSSSITRRWNCYLPASFASSSGARNCQLGSRDNGYFLCISFRDDMVIRNRNSRSFVKERFRNETKPKQYGFSFDICTFSVPRGLFAFRILRFLGASFVLKRAMIIAIK